MKIEIIDGVEIDISGPLRKLRLKDGWYVVGEGSLDTVDLIWHKILRVKKAEPKLRSVL
jgi:hypothetical protein